MLKSSKKITQRVLTAVAVIAMSLTTATAVEWRLGHVLPPDHPGNRALEAAASEIAERTDNRIEIVVFPAGQIGGAKEILTGLQIGTHHMAFDGAGVLSQWEKQMGVFEAPFLSKDFAHLDRLMDSEQGKKIVEKLRAEQGLRLLDAWYYGTRHMTNNVRPIETIDDVSGLKIRVPEVQLSLAFATALGAKATPMAFSELYLGLQTGVVDGQENPLPTIKAAKFFEVQKNLALTSHLVQFVGPIVSEAAWNVASEEDRAIVMEVMQKYGDIQTKSVIDAEASLVSELEEAGMQVTRPDQAPFKAAMEPVYAEFSDVWGPGTYEALSKID